MWDLIVSVPDHCLSFYFSHDVAQIQRTHLTEAVSECFPDGMLDIPNIKMHVKQLINHMNVWDNFSLHIC